MGCPAIPRLWFVHIPGSGKAPITQHNSAIPFVYEEDVIELDVSMNPTVLVSIVDSMEDLLEVVANLGLWQTLTSSRDEVVDCTP